VRGYSERSIGPENSRGEPSGGLSVVEAGLEMRSRFWGDVGGALFVEGGSVSEEVAPVFDEGVQVAAGGGLRYFSPVGPIRVDVGVPVNPRDSDDAFQVYLSIGQAF
jgi:translocation and assembly module TamA